MSGFYTVKKALVNYFWLIKEALEEVSQEVVQAFVINNSIHLTYLSRTHPNPSQEGKHSFIPFYLPFLSFRKVCFKLPLLRGLGVCPSIQYPILVSKRSIKINLSIENYSFHRLLSRFLNKVISGFT